ncbi:MULTISPECIES: type VI secretion system tip protein VgrG [Pseudomonas]|jgi:type VI secretion system secreted protein VgrG|uniref:type VI secretion system Vgr family protein n=1 Tax=Pseudomonas TaxID=286 RepID=UPI000876BB09|nr:MULTISPECIES: type VI secretion system tip protein VgrG [Pseudomonas]SCZ30024.1 type VI secretion system secreted protein VgrG [Pseudomonas sp. NFIX46]SDB26211.1 type VI secretion system secreted protein VgrG [Pseudomonas putida]SFQ93121.1 type VI secretion system secreted protein VgrG [Pseudomonas sp. NFIX49]
MFGASKPVVFRLDIEGVSHDLQVFEFRAREALNQTYQVELELVSERRDLDLEALLHRPAFLSFCPDGSGIHGQIHRVAQGDSGTRLTRYQIVLVPHLAYLAHRHNQRIFQHQSVPQIIARVLSDHGMQPDAWRFQLSADYRPRLYCVQFEETDLFFIQRLCEEEGLHFHFQHSRDGHLLVFGDDQSAFPTPAAPTAYAQGSGMVAETAVIDRFNVRLETRTTHVSRRDYHFEKPTVQLDAEAKETRLPVLEDYRFPGQFTHRDRGRHLSQRALERHRADYRQAQGRSDQSLMRSGSFVDMSEHPRNDYNGLWLLTRVDHVGRQPQVLEESATDLATADGFTQGYRNHFVATPWDVIFRPALEHRKPRINGNQHAVVTGPPGEEIYCDAYGRVKVQLLWDREGQLNEQSSCWLRVATGWAHDQYGSVQIPRVGMEVLVGFTEGDPDKPFVLGCLPNAVAPVPLDLPAEQTRSIWRSQSSPGGGGYNELRIEDKKGAEEIAIRAQRDLVQLVLNDQRVQVDNQRTVVVGGIASHELHSDEHHLTHGNRLTEIKQDDHLWVQGDRHIRVASQRLSAGQQIHLGAGQQVVIDGGTHVTIKAGGHWLTLGLEGICSSVPILQGGAPAPGIAAQPLVPGALPLLKVAFDPVQQRHALLSTRTSRCLICEAARA